MAASTSNATVNDATGTRKHEAAEARQQVYVFGGCIGEVGLSDLLATFEQLGKTGRLLLVGPDSKALIELIDGRIVDARSSVAIGDPVEILMMLLDWDQGFFKLVSSPQPPCMNRHAVTTVAQLLLERARLRDEATRKNPKLVGLQNLRSIRSTLRMYR